MRHNALTGAILRPNFVSAEMTNFVFPTYPRCYSRQIEVRGPIECYITDHCERKVGQSYKLLNESDLKEGKPGFFGQALYWKDN